MEYSAVLTRISCINSLKSVQKPFQCVPSKINARLLREIEYCKMRENFVENETMREKVVEFEREKCI